MNTVDNKPKIAFGMMFTTRTDEMFLELGKKVAGETVRKAFAGSMTPLQRDQFLFRKLEKLKNDSLSRDLTLDFYKAENGEYKADVFFSEGQKMRRGAACENAGKSPMEALSGINLVNLKAFRKTLRKQYLEAVVTLNNISKPRGGNSHNSAEVNGLISIGEFKSKFVGNSSENLRYAFTAVDFDHLSELVKGTPKLKFRITEHPERKYFYQLDIASEDYPKAGFATVMTHASPSYLLNNASAEQLNKVAQSTLKNAHEKA